MKAYAFADTDYEWKQMIKLRNNCITMGVSIPPEVENFLNKGNEGIDKCPPNRPKGCGRRLHVDGVDEITVRLNVDWTTEATIIDLTKLLPDTRYLLLMDDDWNDRSFV